MRLVSFLIAAALGLAALAAVPAAAQQVQLTQLTRGTTADEWILDYSGAPWADEVGSVEVLRCQAGGKACDLLSVRRPTADRRVVLRGAGYYGVRLKRRCALKAEADCEVWIQAVPILRSPDASIRALAAKHLPLMSFHDAELRFPVSVESVYGGFRVGDLETYGRVGFADLPESTLLSDALPVRGSYEYVAFIVQDKLLALDPGRRDRFPMYWHHELSADGATLWITYSLIYSYDYKGDAIGANPANHGLDRESVTLEFARAGADWQPARVHYAGHLETQPTEFLGCADAPVCAQPGRTALATWPAGRTQVAWDNASRRGDRPIVYVARGSHAVFPAFGHYRIVNSSALPDLVEPAGNPDARTLTEASTLIELDLAQPAVAPLLFSGLAIDGVGLKNSRLPPHLRYPFETWSAGSPDVISGCTACAPYVQRLQETFSRFAFNDSLTDAVAPRPPLVLVGSPAEPSFVPGANLSAVQLVPGQHLAQAAGHLVPAMRSDGNHSFSIAAWVRFDAWSAQTNAIVYEREAGGADPCNVPTYGLSNFENDGRRWFLMLSTLNEQGACVPEYLWSPETARTGEWYHVAVTYDQDLGLARLYVDTRLVVERAVGRRLSLPPNPYLSVGQQPWSGISQSLNGVIDELHFFRSALTKDEVLALAQRP